MSDKLDSLALVNNEEISDTSPQVKGKRSNNAKAGDNANEGANSGGVDDQPMFLQSKIRRRVNALRKLQYEAVNFETEFYRKVHELECEYAEKMAPLHEKRKKIVNGILDPTDEECEFSVPFDEEFLADELDKQAAIVSDLPEQEKALYGKGLDEFWLTVFRNDSTLGGLIQNRDEPILRYLTDVEVKTLKQPMMFTLYFHFLPNEYFTNTVLTKQYSMKCQLDSEDPFSFTGPEIVGSKGCTIDWKPGKNVTVEIVNKKQKHKKKGVVRIVPKEVKSDSFFNFFDPPVIPESVEEVDEKTQFLAEEDFEIGQILRDQVIPRAVLYYTGEVREEDDDYDDEDEEGDDEEDMDSDMEHERKNQGEGGSDDEDDDE